MTNNLLTLVTLLEFLVAIASWLFSALGYPVNNLFSDEGLRWSLRYGFGTFPQEYSGTFLLFCIALGVLPSWRDKSAIRRMIIYLVVLWVLILAYVLWPASPLRGVNGGFYPSPFVHSLPLLICLSVILVNLLMNLSSVGETLINGIRRYAVLIVFYLLLSFLFSEIAFIWQ